VRAVVVRAEREVTTAARPEQETRPGLAAAVLAAERGRLARLQELAAQVVRVAAEGTRTREAARARPAAVPEEPMALPAPRTVAPVVLLEAQATMEAL
jgi:hypothetical protein